LSIIIIICSLFCDHDVLRFSIVNSFFNNLKFHRSEPYLYFLCAIFLWYPNPEADWKILPQALQSQLFPKSRVVIGIIIDAAWEIWWICRKCSWSGFLVSSDNLIPEIENKRWWQLNLFVWSWCLKVLSTKLTTSELIIYWSSVLFGFSWTCSLVQW
jgi:hypothetical protein